MVPKSDGEPPNGSSDLPSDDSIVDSASPLQRPISASLEIAGVPLPELITRIKESDPQALAMLHQHLYASLWRLAVHLVRSSAIAEEVIQEVFLALWRRRSALHQNDDLRAYLFASVRNRARDHARHTSVELATETAIQQQTLDAALVGRIGPTPDVAAENAAFQAAYRHAISVLSEREAMVLMLRWDEEMTLDQISEVIGISIEGVRKVIGRAQQKLQALLKEYRS